MKNRLSWFLALLIAICLSVQVYSQESTQQDTTQIPDFEPIPDRWRGILPPSGRKLDPYNQNVLKGDYPIIGQDVFFILTAVADNFAEFTTSPRPAGISTARPFTPGFFGDENLFFVNENLRITLELYKGNTAFKPREWELKVTTVFNANYLNTKENNNVNINPLKGTNRFDNTIAFEELFIEKHLFDLNDRYDFVSLKAGIQRFNSDFRGFIFTDYNLGGRLFGSAGNNKWQYNLAYFRQLEKDTNSGLNTIFEDRGQDVFVANLFKQDFLTLGYTGQLSFHYNHDKPSIKYNENGVPERPSVVGSILPKDVKAYYIGWTGDGHFGRWNINHAFYQVFGKESINSLADRPIDINAQLAALELSVDVDWKRYKFSAFYSSGDSDPLDGKGTGFDAIFDLPFFAGGPFSYWNIQPIRLFGVNLTQKLSLVPNLRASKIEGQSNFVNPGLLLFNAAFEAEVTPKLKTVLNANYLQFVDTSSLEIFGNQSAISSPIGLDYGLGIIYRPFLNNNAIFTLSATALTPFSGFKDLYETGKTRYALFTSLIFTY